MDKSQNLNWEYKITVMFIPTFAGVGSSHSHSTPIKMGKTAATQPLTAESDQSDRVALSEISANELFEKFSKLVTISEDDDFPEGIFQDQEIERKLQYEISHPHFKLSFEPGSSSMKKSTKFREQPIQDIKGTNLFQIPSKLTVPTQADNLKDLSEQECSTPLTRPSLDRADLQETPQKARASEE